MAHQFKGEIEGYTVNYCRAHGWKIAHSHDEDDFMQMAWLVFHKCAERYPNVEPKHFMALYKTALERKVINLAKMASRRVATEVVHRKLDIPNTRMGGYVTYTEPEYVEFIGEAENAGYLCRLITQAPYEVRLVLSLFLSAPSELLEAAMSAWSARGNQRAGGNDHLCKLLGLPVGSKPLDAVEEYFTN